MGRELLSSLTRDEDPVSVESDGEEGDDMDMGRYTVSTLGM